MGATSADRPRLITAREGSVTAPSFSPVASMATIAHFPWVRACVDAIAADLAGRPLRIQRGRGADAEVVQVPDLARLLSRPSSTKRGNAFRQQMVTHLLLAGNAYILRIGPNPRKPISLKLLHPEGIRVIPDAYGDVAGYEWTPAGGSPVVYDASTVAHVSTSAWEHGAEGLMGEGLIRALRNDLEADQAAAKLSASQARQGRPTAIFSTTDQVGWTPEQAAAIQQEYARIVAENQPSLAIGAQLKVDFPTFTLRDMEFTTQRTLTRDTILAAFGVPPSRVGLPTANYATSREQMGVYWQTLVARATVLDEALSSIAEGWAPDLSIRHDFSDVDALQASRDARLARVGQWVMLGAAPADAAAYEGFDDAPVGEQPAADAAPQALAVNEPLARYLSPILELAYSRTEPAAEPAAAEEPDMQEEQRAAEWRGWLSEVHDPAEKRLSIAIKSALKQQSEAIAANLGTIGEQRDFLADQLGPLLNAIFPKGVQDLLQQIAWNAFRGGVRSAYVRAAKQVGGTLAADRVDPLAQQLMAVMVVDVNGGTRDMLATLISQAMQEGASVNEMQARIQAATGFSPMRALRIARTETTRSAAAGQERAYQDAGIESGVSIRKQWLSSRDSEVRDAHRLLDGQEVAIGQPFVIPDGEHAGLKASGPGDFDRADLSVNCRCTIIPVVNDD